MSVHLHPWLGLIWLLLTVAELYLWSRIEWPSWFGAYMAAVGFRDALALTMSALIIPYPIYKSFYWTTQPMIHALAAVCVILYAIRALRYRQVLWFNRAHADNTFLALAGIMCAVIGVRYLVGTGTNSAVRFLEMGAVLLVAGASWVAWYASQEKVVMGFCILYSASVILAAVWAFVDTPWPTIWAVEFAIQVIAIWWWLRCLRKERAK